MRIKKEGLRTWIEIEKKALRKNYRTFRKLLKPNTKLMAVVKSNAYGHGLVDFVQEIKRLGIDYLGVDSIVEALRLRKNGVTTPMLVLGYTLSENFEKAVKHNIEITLSSFSQLRLLEKLKTRKPITVHIKIDTGMHRQGFYPEDAKKLIRLLNKTTTLSIKGIYTHFANGKNPNSPADSRKQIERFRVATETFEEAGFRNLLKHTCATSGAFLYPEYHFNMVRVGIGMYGLWPSHQTRQAFGVSHTLCPALSWKAIISEVKKIPKGERIGYDYTESFTKDTKIAIIPIGYWHGYVRALSSVGNVLIKGKRARVLGRISMDMIVVDISHISTARTGDIVTILGKDHDERVTAEELAAHSGTTNYEVLTRINSRIKRFYT